MAETIKESLFDKLLKSRYPLTRYLNRQQEFIKIFPTTTTQTVIGSILSECETSIIRRRKTPYPSSSNKAHIINPQVPELYDAPNGMTSDQDYNTAHDRSSETDDDAGVQEYDARPLSKSKFEFNCISSEMFAYSGFHSSQ